LNSKVYNEVKGPEKPASKAVVVKFETDIETNNKNDEAFMKKIEKRKQINAKCSRRQIN
jgi:hypothetical protein